MDSLLVSAGPAYLPIIPTFPFQMLIEPIYKSTSKYNELYENIIIRISATSTYYDYTCDLRKIRIVLSDGRVFEPSEYDLTNIWEYNPKESITVSEKPILNGKRYSFKNYDGKTRWSKDRPLWINLLFPVSEKTTEKFTLIIDEAFLYKTNELAEPILVPDIVFQWSNGFRMLMGP